MVRRGRGRGAASAIATLGLVAIVTGLVILSFVALIPAVSEIVTTSANGAGQVDSTAGGAAGWLADLVQAFGLGALVPIAELVVGLAGLFIVLLIATLLTFYFLKDGTTLWASLTRRLPAGRRSEVDLAGTRAVKVLGGYMIATGAVSAFAAATQFLIMVVLGIPLALPLGVLSFFGGFIPYIGSMLTTTAALLVTIATGSPTDVAIMVIWTVGFNIVQGNVIAPLVYGRAVNLHPAVVLLSIPAGGAVAGVLGMFLAVPFIGVVAATWRIVLRVFEVPPPATEAPMSDAGAETPAVELPLGADSAPAS
jgi:predicted PurR-regulated permease PerM